MADHDAYEQARQRVRAMRGFYIHLLFYILVNGALFIINLAAGAAHGAGWWFYWPLLGWGVGLAAHAVGVFGLRGWLGPEWEERKIKEQLSKRG
jgi:heme/copper-type cytochrome/quinol oxidase subunit 1